MLWRSCQEAFMRTPLVLLVLVLGASPALARPDEDAECTTTTTVRCTGAAALYGAPPATLPPAPPQAAPAPPEAAPAPPETAPAPPEAAPAPPPAYAPPRLVLIDPRAYERGGWHITQDANGTIYRERRRSTASRGTWAAGLGLFAGTWALGIVSGVVWEQRNPPAYIMPVLGAWIQAAFQRSSDEGARAGWAVNGAVQAAGFITMLVGFAAGPAKVERQPIVVGPLALQGGGGLYTAGRF
jgi:hypothetical protein